jgi:hypothetical protein
MKYFGSSVDNMLEFKARLPVDFRSEIIHIYELDDSANLSERARTTMRALLYCINHFIPFVGQYYSCALEDTLERDVVRLIAEFASEGYFVKQRLDVYDLQGKRWRAAEVMEIDEKYKRIYVVYII